VVQVEGVDKSPPDIIELFRGFDLICGRAIEPDNDLTQSCRIVRPKEPEERLELPVDCWRMTRQCRSLREGFSSH